MAGVAEDTWFPIDDGTGLDSIVHAVVAGADGNFYFGGNFTTAGAVGANRVARWDGSDWTPLGSGMNGAVRRLSFLGEALYAGGSFGKADGATAVGVARWDGVQWRPLGLGTNGTVYAMAAARGNLYVGGDFDRAGGLTANRIARWDGTSWSTLGSGLNGIVRALAVDGTTVYAGGDFTLAGGAGASHVACWNGSAWTALGSGLNDRVVSLAVTDSGLAAGGDFILSGSKTMNHIALWNGSTWTQPGGGIAGSVLAIAPWRDEIIATGLFNFTGGGPASRIARYDGNSWAPVDTGLSAAGRSLAVVGRDLHVGGDFTSAGGKPVGYAARAVLIYEAVMEIEQPAGTPLEDGATVDFGSAAIGSTNSSRTFTLRNSGNTALTVSPPLPEGDDASLFSTNTLSFDPLVPDGEITFKIGFNPIEEVDAEASIVLETNDTGQPTVTIVLKGSGITAAALFEAAAAAAGLENDDATAEAIPFGDGLANLIKFGSNLNLGASDYRQLEADGEAGLPLIELVLQEESTLLRFEFLRRKGSGLVYTPQVSDSLEEGSFAGVAGDQTITDIDDAWERVVLLVPIDPTIQPRLFARVRIGLP